MGLYRAMAHLTLTDTPLSDGVVTLRGFESSDVDMLVELCRDPEIPRWTLVPSPYTAQHAHEYLDKHNLASQAVATRAGFVSVPQPAFRRPETVQFVDDIFLPRRRGG